MNRRQPGLTLTKVLLYAFLAVVVLLPLIRMLWFMRDTDVWGMLSSRRFGKALRNSLTSASVSTLLSVGIATLLSWGVVRTGMRHKGLWATLFSLPMLIPSLSHGMGLVVLLGANGVLTNLFHLSWNVYGFWGIVVGSVMYSFPVAFLMVSDILRYEDSLPYEAARVLGIGKFRQFTAITLPYIRKPMISTFFAVFTMIVTDYGVPQMVGGQYTTLPVMMYQDVIGLLDFGKGSVIGLVLLVPAVVAFVLELLNQDRGNSAFVTKPFEIRKNGGRDMAATLLCLLVSLCVMLPIGAFVVLTFVTKYPSNMTFTFGNILRALNMNAGQYFWNSVIIGLLVAALGTALSVTVGYLTARMPSKSTRLLHLLSIVTLAIPGIVLGLSYVLFFKGSFLYGTLAILVLVNMVHFFASPYLMIYNTFGKLNADLEAVGATLGLSRVRVLWGVLLPQARLTIVDMFSYFFVNSMMTISAVSFLATVSTKPVSLMITSFEATMLLECAAFVSLLILVANILMKGGLTLLKRKLSPA